MPAFRVVAVVLLGLVGLSLAKRLVELGVALLVLLLVLSLVFPDKAR